MKRRLISLLLCATCISMLAGCGSSTGNTDTSSGSDTEAIEAKTITPMSSEIDLSNVEGATLRGEFSAADFAEDENGNLVLQNAKFYEEEVFDIVDINTMAVGDTIVVDGDACVIETLEEDENGGKVINGGIENDGLYLAPVDEDNCYKFFGYDDVTSYALIGEASFSLRSDMQYIDVADLDNKVSTDYEGFKELLPTLVEKSTSYSKYATSVVIENNEIIEITRDYIP